jgi:hypothetical protein
VRGILSLINLHIYYFRRRRAQSLRYLKSNDDHHEHLNASLSDHHYPKKPIQIEHPHLLSSSPTIISSLPSTNHHRPNSSSSMINNDGLSDRESLLKLPSRNNATSTNIDDFYEEIKEQQQQTNLGLGTNHDINPYLDPKSFEDHKSSKPIGDHREVFYYECEV